ncbi:hypothetical protein KVT40_007514 [Elsinoe batatas]|uniref:Protein kinase domain-containing protein n=1 Tax=Elsinoe batatas TaxID=2601811 RepID=A0A8K0KVS6_9PEZI|nr:hypothetical protein KVT40_007514 [Elsinoe batatas]
MSTLTGRSGRIYSIIQGVHKRPSDSKHTIFKAMYVGSLWTRQGQMSLTEIRSGEETYLLKHVPKPVYHRSHRIAAELPDSRRLRLHNDCNDEQYILVHPSLRETLLTFITKSGDSEIDFISRRTILRQVGEAIQELRPEMRLSYWGQDLGPEALQLVAAMTSLEPAARPSIDEIMGHEWWTIDN